MGGRFSNYNLIKRHSSSSNLVDCCSRGPSSAGVEQSLRGVVGGASLVVKLNVVELDHGANIPMHLVVGIMGVFGGPHKVGSLGGMGYDVIGQPLPQHCCQGYQPLLGYSVASLEGYTVLVIEVYPIEVVGKHIVG